MPSPVVVKLYMGRGKLDRNMKNICRVGGKASFLEIF